MNRRMVATLAVIAVVALSLSGGVTANVGDTTTTNGACVLPGHSYTTAAAGNVTVTVDAHVGGGATVSVNATG
jgi:hypothetical protein